MHPKNTALIVEDDTQIMEQLHGFLTATKLFNQIFQAPDCLQAMLILQHESVDVLFLDIGLPAISGFDLLTMFPQHPPTIIITSSAEYAVESYSYNVTDFLLKPLTYTRVVYALQRAFGQPVSAPKPSGLAIPEVHIQPTLTVVKPAVSAYIFLKKGRKTQRFTIEDIFYIEAYAIYARVVTKNETTAVNEKISLLTQQLQASNFLRVHKSFVVNTANVNSFNTLYVWVGPHKIPIGITYKKQTLAFLQSLSHVSQGGDV